MESHCCHWCCEGLKHDTIFQDTKEFIAGMNRIAVCYLHCIALGRPVSIRAFCLLHKYFHFVLYGSVEDTAVFMEHYRYLTGRWIRDRRRERLHGRMRLGYWVSYERETTRKMIIYNLRQAMESGTGVTPQGYPWCSAGLMFSNSHIILSCCKQVSEYSGREIRRIIYSKTELPQCWMVLPDSVIWPGCYTDYKMAMASFNGVGDFLSMLNNEQVDGEVSMKMSESLPSIPDAEVRDAARDIAGRQYGRPFLSKCTPTERLAIACRLHQELHCGYKQLAGIMKMKGDDLRKSLAKNTSSPVDTRQ